MEWIPHKRQRQMVKVKNKFLVYENGSRFTSLKYIYVCMALMIVICDCFVITVEPKEEIILACGVHTIRDTRFFSFLFFFHMFNCSVWASAARDIVVAFCVCIFAPSAAFAVIECYMSRAFAWDSYGSNVVVEAEKKTHRTNNNQPPVYQASLRLQSTVRELCSRLHHKWKNRLLLFVCRFWLVLNATIEI